MPQNIEALLTQSSDFVVRRIPLSDVSSIRVGNEPTFIAYPRNEGELISLFRLFSGHNINYRTVGAMTNLLPPDTAYDGVIISTSKMNSVSFSGEYVSADCGVRVSGLIQKAKDRSLGGMEALSGIPGTVGGMLYSNAGAFGSEISDFLVSVRLYSFSEDRIISLDKTMLFFGYRESFLHSREHCLLSAVFKLDVANKDTVAEKIRFYKLKRSETQPVGQYSLGSVFKRVNGVSAAYYIDKSGLKGYSIGGAAVSQKHAGFIVNKGGATSADFKALVRFITDKVYENYGISLVREVEYL